MLELRAGDKLAEIEGAVKNSAGLILYWTPEAAESEWVEREVGWAIEAQAEDYRILIVLPGGQGRGSAKRLFDDEPVFISVEDPEDAVPPIRAALRLRAPSGRVPPVPGQRAQAPGRAHRRQ